MGEAKKISKIAKGKNMRSVVFSGSKEKTRTGLTQSDLMRNKFGKIVSKKASAAGKKKYASIKGWVLALQKAKQELGFKGFVAVKKGSPLYKRAKELYTQ